MKKLLLLVLLAALTACSQLSPVGPEPTLAPTVATSVQRPAIPISRLASKRVMVAVVFGQSNAANSGQSRLNPGPEVYSFHKGNLYAGYDPLPGSTRNRGSVWTRLGRKLVAQGKYDAVVFVAMGVSGSQIAQWTPGGFLNRRLLREIRGLKSRGLSPTHLLWHQGEADNQLRTNKEVYKKRFLSMLGSIRKQGVNAPIYVSTATRYKYKGPNQQLRQAQRELVNPARGILAGPDTDRLGAAYRYDGTHFNNGGLNEFANLWMVKLSARVSTPQRRAARPW